MPHIEASKVYLCFQLLFQKQQMDLQNVQNQSMSLVLSTDAKPRLKWTPELHQRFSEAINQLGGAESKYTTKLK